MPASLPAGATGEICVRGPAVFAGYYNNPDANAKAFAGGWFHTGDLGHMDARGFVYITGRASDMYISGGSNVYPREIEEALLAHPAVAEACVVGMPHEKWGECGVAVLVLTRRPVADDELLARHLTAGWRNTNGRRAFVFWPELPKSGYGKVTKREVKRLLEEQDMADAPKDIAAIECYHAHIYYDPARSRIAPPPCASRWSAPSACGWEAGTTGRSGRTPSRCIRSRSAPRSFPTLVPFLMLNRMGLTMLLHPQYGRPRDDHTSMPSGWARSCR